MYDTAGPAKSGTITLSGIEQGHMSVKGHCILPVASPLGE